MRPDRLPPEAVDSLIPIGRGRDDWMPRPISVPDQSPSWDPLEDFADGPYEPPTLAPSPVEAPAWSRVSDLLAPPQADEWYVEDLLRPGRIHLIVATEGLGKSWITRELALRCSTGRGSLFGRLAVHGARSVAVIDEDNGPREEWHRDELLLAHVGLERSELDRYVRLSDAGVLLTSARWQRDLRERIEADDVEVLILDPISEMYDAREVREELRPVHRYLRTLRRDFPRLAIVAAHHLRKPPTRDATSVPTLADIRGGGWGQMADVVVLVYAKPGGAIHWETHKRIQRTSFHLRQLESGPFVHVAEDEDLDARSVDRVLASIDAGAGSIEDLTTALAMSRAAVYRAIRELRQVGILAKGLPFRRLDE